LTLEEDEVVVTIELGAGIVDDELLGLVAEDALDEVNNCITVLDVNPLAFESVEEDTCTPLDEEPPLLDAEDEEVELMEELCIEELRIVNELRGAELELAEEPCNDELMLIADGWVKKLMLVKDAVTEELGTLEAAGLEEPTLLDAIELRGLVILDRVYPLDDVTSGELVKLINETEFEEA